MCIIVNLALAITKNFNLIVKKTEKTKRKEKINLCYLIIEGVF